MAAKDSSNLNFIKHTHTHTHTHTQREREIRSHTDTLTHTERDTHARTYTHIHSEYIHTENIVCKLLFLPSIKVRKLNKNM